MVIFHGIHVRNTTKWKFTTLTMIARQENVYGHTVQITLPMDPQITQTL